MSRYHADNRMGGTQQAITTTYKSQMSVCAATATLCRGRVVAMAYGSDSVPNATDCNIVYTIERQTVAGTGGSTLTPNPIYPADVASRSVVIANFTAEGTYTLPIFTRVLNQRASQQWAAQDNDAMLNWPATNLNGLVLLALSPTFNTAVFMGADYEDQ
jgi:hypothetical protein